MGSQNARDGGTLVGSDKYERCDTHIDPPAVAIGICSLLLNLLY